MNCSTTSGLFQGAGDGTDAIEVDCRWILRVTAAQQRREHQRSHGLTSVCRGVRAYIYVCEVTYQLTKHV